MGISTTRIETETVPGEAIQKERSVRPCVLVIFGATGDLAKRKLIPAIYNLTKESLLPDAFEIVGIGRSAPDEAAFRAAHEETTRKFSRTKPVDEAVWSNVASRIHYVIGDHESESTYTGLKAKLDALDATKGTQRNRIFFFSTPPSASSRVPASMRRRCRTSRPRRG